MPAGLDAVIERLQADKAAERVQREKQQGVGRGIITGEMNGVRLVAVGNTIFQSKKWATFHDFLRYYLADRLDVTWFNAELKKPAGEQHVIARWHLQAVVDIKRLGTQVGPDMLSGPMTGAYRAFMNLAYNIYLIEHHAEPKDAKRLVHSFVSKLKSERSDDFVGKLFETYAATAFLKAGFALEHENEADPNSSHVEFIATYPPTGRKFSVEVKSRNRAAGEDGPVDEFKRLRVGSKLNRALAKHAAHDRVVMIEVNIPDIVTSFDGWPKAALQQIRDTEKQPAPDGTAKPSAYVIVTNHAFHNNLDALAGTGQVLAAGCNIPDFGPDVPFNGLKAVYSAEARNREMFALLDSMRTHYDIPSTFDGAIPEFEFELPKDHPRLKIGEWYIVPKEDGTETQRRLYEAIVVEAEKRFYGVYESPEGEHFIASAPLSDAELRAWKRHPETFFGQVREVQQERVKNWLEMARFMHKTYKSTPREKMLEWMKDARDIEALKTLSQEELAIAYCERCALSLEYDKANRQQA